MVWESSGALDTLLGGPPTQIILIIVIIIEKYLFPLSTRLWWYVPQETEYQMWHIECKATEKIQLLSALLKESSSCQALLCFGSYCKALTSAISRLCLHSGLTVQGCCLCRAGVWKVPQVPGWELVLYRNKWAQQSLPLSTLLYFGKLSYFREIWFVLICSETSSF